MPNYIDESELRRLIDGGDQAELYRVLLLMATGIIERYRFDDDGGEAAHDAATHALTKVNKYNSIKGNAFAYMSQIIKNWCHGRSKTEKRRREHLQTYYNQLNKE